MTEKSKKIVEENHNLIYGFMNKEHLAMDEWYDICAIGLCKAAESYNNEKNAVFATYAYSCMKNEVNHALRDLYAEKRGCNTTESSFEQINEEYGTEVHFENAAYTPSVEEICMMNNIYEKVLQGLSPREQKIMNLCKAGYNNKEISEILGCNTREIGFTMQSIRMRFQIELSDKNLVFFDPRQQRANY